MFLAYADLSAIMILYEIQMCEKEPITGSAYKAKSCIQEQGRRIKAREILVTKVLYC